MKISTYSTAWSVVSKSFDYKGALDNWFTFSDEVSIAVPNSDTDDSAALIAAYAKERGYNVVITRTDFALDGSDPFAYGKTENAALQVCTGELLCQQNLDERMVVSRNRLEELHQWLQSHPQVKAFWVPTVDLYGSRERCLPQPNKKWYIHGRGVYRGAWRGGIKADGFPDYNKTSTDEAITENGDLVSAVPLTYDMSFPVLKTYVDLGFPLVFHVGYLSFGERLDRSLWWREYWERATSGDKNSHPTSVEEIAARETVEHGLPLWPTK